MNVGFRAQTLYPTPEVTKEPDYYGYDGCLNYYEADDCFDNYYGYDWCLNNYEEDKCFEYYYGHDEDVQEWGPQDSYKWCLIFNNKEWCQFALFAYLGVQPDPWNWLYIRYNDCLKTELPDICDDQWYGYVWCLSSDDYMECNEYYYPYKAWDEERVYNWCLNFYTDDECRYLFFSGEVENVSGNADYSSCLSFYDEEYCAYKYLEGEEPTYLPSSSPTYLTSFSPTELEHWWWGYGNMVFGIVFLVAVTGWAMVSRCGAKKCSRMTDTKEEDHEEEKDELSVAYV